MLGFADASGERLLTDERFTEIGFGVSVLSPAEARRVEAPEDGSVAAWRLDEDFTLRLRVTSSPQAFDDIAEVVNQAWAGSWVGLTQSAPRFVETEGTTLAERKAVIQVAELDREPPALLNAEQRALWDDTPLFYGQAALKLDPYTVAVLEVYAPDGRSERAEALLRAAADSLMVMPPPQLFEIRRTQVAAGYEWKSRFDRRAVFEAAEPEAWFRLEREGQPVGYEQRVVRTDPPAVAKLRFALRDPGVAVGVNTVTQRDGVELNVWRQAYADDSGELETWSVFSELSTLPPAGQRQVFAHEPKVVSWSETGLRDGRLLTLAYQKPPDEEVIREVQRAERFRGQIVDANVLFARHEKNWDIPDRLPPGLIDETDEPIPPTQVYLGQAELVLVPSLLPGDREQTYAFYAYDSDAGTLSLRTYEVRPLRDGGWRVIERPTPSSPPIRHRFDRRGQLQEVIQPNGLRSVRSSRNELALTWPELRQRLTR